MYSVATANERYRQPPSDGVRAHATPWLRGLRQRGVQVMAPIDREAVTITCHYFLQSVGGNGTPIAPGLNA
jgi:hypothetical protein